MLSVEEVSVRYGGRPVLDGLSLTVGDGEILAVLGPSGSGKSTLLRVIAGLEHPEEGRVCWDGEDLARVPPHRRNFGLMFQDYALFPHRDVAGNVAFGLRMAGRPGRERTRRVEEVLAWVGLEGFEGRSVQTLSGGEQQRVALARALAPAPDLLMLDEPLGSLDRALRERLTLELREILCEPSLTGIYVTHDQEEAFAVADRVALLHEGRIVQAGRPDEVWTRPADEWVARFLGFTAILHAEVREGRALTPWGWFPAPRGAEGTITAVLRPEGLSLSDGRAPVGPDVGGTGAADDDTGPGLRAVVRTDLFRGGHRLLTAALEGGPELQVEVPVGVRGAAAAPEPGARVLVQVEPSAVSVIPAGAALEP